MNKILEFIFIIGFILLFVYLYAFTNIFYNPYGGNNGDGGMVVTTAPDNLRVYVSDETVSFYPATPITQVLLYRSNITNLRMTTIDSARILGYHKDTNFDCFSYTCGIRCFVKKLFNIPATPWDKQGNWIFECKTHKLIPRLDIDALRLRLAAEYGDKGLVKQLLSMGVKVNTFVNEYGETALLIACHNGRADIAQILLDAGADWNIKSNNGTKPLMDACSNGHSSVVKVLLSAGANANENDDGLTVLMVASQKGYTDVVNALISAGANVNDQTAQGVTALMWASFGGHSETVQALLAAGADYKLVDEEGYTALVWAVQTGKTEIVKILLEGGANANVSDKEGNSVLTMAQSNGYNDIEKLLRQFGADY